MNDEWLVGLDEYDTPGRPSVDDDLAVALDLPADHPVHLTAGPAYDEDEDPDDYPAVYAPQVVPPWTTALVFDVALGLDAEDVIFRRHNITREEWEHISTHPMFLRQVGEQAREMGETGIGFRAKAKVQAEMYLVDIDRMVASPSTDQKVKLEAIRSVVKWAGLEPTPSREEGSSTPQVNIQINM